MKFKLWHVPVRAATGAFILNSGLSKLQSNDDEMHKGVHGMASTAYPQVGGLEPKTFTRILGAAETALGAALLAPFISPGLAGAGLTAFSAGLMGMYFKIPGMTEDGIRPSRQGLAMAKDSWLLAIGVALMLDRASNKVRDTIPTRS
ncbi:MAG TPA: hypothetical protein VFN68_06950 [Acidimicrobiales bacterium]|nr:hypothetical protein [Acidimicrobiales bacterium]